jgi:L-fucose isomerase-like protein
MPIRFAGDMPGNAVLFGYATVASDLHDAATVDQIVADVRSTLDRLGGVSVEAADALPDVPLAILAATGGTEAAIDQLVRQRRRVVPFEPVLVLAHPLHNSLPSALEAMARVHMDGGRGRIVQVAADRPASLTESIADVTAIHRLHRTRLGQVGQPSPWLVASVPDRDLLRRGWGVEVVDVDIGETIDACRTGDPGAARPVAMRYSRGAPPTPELLDAAALHPVLVATADRAHVDAITVRCFDYLGTLHTSGCVALAELNDAGFVAGCEGDVASAVAMLLVRVLLEQPSWIANPAVIDEAEDRLLLAHCTVAPSMVDDVELHTHFESGLGIGLRGRFAPGPATLIRLGGPALERLWVANATIEHAGDADDLCRTQVSVRLDDSSAQQILDAPLGNHIVLFHGHHRDRIERWWRLAFG